VKPSVVVEVALAGKEVVDWEVACATRGSEEGASVDIVGGGSCVG